MVAFFAMMDALRQFDLAAKVSRAGRSVAMPPRLRPAQGARGRVVDDGDFSGGQA